MFMNQIYALLNPPFVLYSIGLIWLFFVFLLPKYLVWTLQNFDINEYDLLGLF